MLGSVTDDDVWGLGYRAEGRVGKSILPKDRDTASRQQLSRARMSLIMAMLIRADGCASPDRCSADRCVYCRIYFNTILRTFAGYHFPVRGITSSLFKSL